MKSSIDIMTGAKFTQTAFCSAPAQAMIVHMKTEGDGVDFSASLDSLLQHDVDRLADNHLVLRGKCPSQVDPNYHNLELEPIIYDERPSIEFELHLYIRVEGGSVSVNDDKEILVSGAREATLFIVTATTYPEVMSLDRYSSMRKLCLSRIQAADKLSYEELVLSHVEDYRQLYGRVELTLDAADFTHLSTDQRLQLLREGGEDRGLVELFFQYGRYLLIASSRPGTQPANLQGIWNREIRPPWSSNYTTNINAEMNYWPVEVCNLSECHEPLFTLIETLAQTGAEMAAVAFGSRGWTANHNTDMWGLANTVGKGEGSVFWAFWPMAGAWLSQHLWEHYQFTKDEAFLRSRAYPLMKGAALFCPELTKAARISLERRLNSGGGHTGWSCAWIINLFARLEDAESAYRYVQQLLKKSTYPNLFNAHPPFQIDGNFGGIAGIAEMLLQSHAGEISLLPALPKAWANGEIRGLVARGGFEISLRWELGKLVDGTIYSKHGGSCMIRSKSGLIVEAAEAETERLEVQTVGLYRYHFATLSGAIYKLRPQL